jgi:hypothetical protein
MRESEHWFRRGGLKRLNAWAAVSVILRSLAFVLVVAAAALIPAPIRAAGSPGRTATQSKQPAAAGTT